jgi:hypothetical protein
MIQLSHRLAVLDDAPAITLLVNSTYRGEGAKKSWSSEAHILGGQRTDLEMIQAAIRDRTQVFLLFENQSQIWASVNLKKSHNRAYLGMLAIHNSMQSQGIGKFVLGECENFILKVWKRYEIEIDVISIRSELIAYYERRGYQLTSEERPFPYGQERFGIPLRKDLRFLVMRKALKLP